MVKYINANDVYDGMRKHGFEAKYITRGEFVDHLPSADVVEVKRGEWAEDNDYVICSICDVHFNKCDNDTEWFNYCPNCGADMRGETE